MNYSQVPKGQRAQGPKIDFPSLGPFVPLPLGPCLRAKRAKFFLWQQAENAIGGGDFLRLHGDGGRPTPEWREFALRWL